MACTKYTLGRNELVNVVPRFVMISIAVAATQTNKPVKCSIVPPIVYLYMSLCVKRCVWMKKKHKRARRKAKKITKLQESRKKGPKAIFSLANPKRV